MNKRALVGCFAIGCVVGLTVLVRASLVGRWPLDEGSGTNAVDTSEGGHHGTLEGSPPPAWTSGVSSNALEFDGAQNEVRVPHEAGLTPSNALTLVAWVRAETNATGEIVAKWSTNAMAGSYLLSLTNGVPQLELMLDGNYTAVAGTSRLTDTNWHQVAGVYDGAEIKVYLDTNLVGRASATGVVDNVEEPLRIGMIAGGVDEVRMYDRTLFAGELATLYIAGTNADGTLAGTVLDSPQAGGETLTVSVASIAGSSSGGTAAAMTSGCAGGCAITNTIRTGDWPIEASVNGGASFTPASVINPQGTYDTIPNTSWVGGPGAGENASTLYRARFVLPDCFSNATFMIKVHCDNAATVFLNGNKIGQQTKQEILENFQDPPEVYSTTEQAYFQPGTNTLLVDAYNFHGPSGLDYEAKAIYQAEWVTSVVWQAYSMGTTKSELDTNPNAGGGLRIFPDRWNPNDITNHTVVLVKAQIREATNNVPVYFTAFDVDDPSASSGPVDNESLPQDNRGQVNGRREG
jgi:hypothetical protein